jgi:hypothetical protein
LRRVATTELARQEWAEGYRRVEAERENASRYGTLNAQVTLITDELRRRVGSVYTLAELAAEYGRAEAWVREVLADRPRDLRWPPGMAVATDAAFHLYSRGARDYEP